MIHKYSWIPFATNSRLLVPEFQILTSFGYPATSRSARNVAFERQWLFRSSLIRSVKKLSMLFFGDHYHVAATQMKVMDVPIQALNLRLLKTFTGVSIAVAERVNRSNRFPVWTAFTIR